MTTTKRAGRPKLAAGARKSEIIRVRVTPAEIDELYQIAHRQGDNLSALVRGVMRRIIRGARQGPTPPAEFT